MYVILTSKPGQFHVETDADLERVESYDYLFYGKPKAQFTIARLDRDTYIRVIEDAPPHVANRVSTKFLEHFPTIERARAELERLAHFGTMDTDLVPRPTL